MGGGGAANIQPGARGEGEHIRNPSAMQPSNLRVMGGTFSMVPARHFDVNFHFEISKKNHLAKKQKLQKKAKPQGLGRTTTHRISDFLG